MYPSNKKPGRGRGEYRAGRGAGPAIHVGEELVFPVDNKLAVTLSSSRTHQSLTKKKKSLVFEQGEKLALMFIFKKGALQMVRPRVVGTQCNTPDLASQKCTPKPT